MTTTRVAALGALALLAVLAGGCRRADDGAARDTLTDRQRDSTIGASSLPGARVVGAAMKAADSIEARNARLDSL